MKKLFMIMLLSLSSNVSFAQISENEKNYMYDLHYIESQPFKHKMIEDNIKRQPVLADYFSIVIKNNEIVLVPYANNSLPEVKNIIDGWKSTLQYNSISYQDEKVHGVNKVKVHLIYKEKPKWVTSTIFD